MRVHVFRDEGLGTADADAEHSINMVLDATAQSTDTRDLVVAVYLLKIGHEWRGQAIRKWLTPKEFCPRRGKWRVGECFGTPPGLPARFKMIRMMFRMSGAYPKDEANCHGWRLRFKSLEEHVAYLFAHELHHFRRYHLGLHPGEGEQSATKWALQRADEMGYHVEARQVRRGRRRKAKEKKISAHTNRNPQLLRRVQLSASHLSLADLKALHIWIQQRAATLEDQDNTGELARHFEKLRSLPDGALVRIRRGDKPDQYEGQTAIKVRTLRRNSCRMVITTPDGKVWRWPMQWLEVVET